MKPAFLCAAAAASALASLSLPVQAATSQKVEQSEWGVSGLPSYVNMYIYVPDKLSAKPPLLVASHHCQGTAASTYSETKSSFVSLADKNGFIIIFPEATGHNCWDVGSSKSLKHDGGGDTHAVAQMVRYALTKYNADSSRVYAFGGSSGAMMTQALMGVYPDLFTAGVAVSGVHCGCWAVDYTGDTASNGQWSGPCADGQVSKSAQQWGDLVRSMFAGYTGHRPRLQLWHGTADTTINYKNLTEAVKEWTNTLALDTTATNTDSKFGGPHELWRNQCGFGVFETFSVTGAGHAVTWDVNTAVGFLGLDRVGGRDPEAEACAIGGAGGSGGSSAAGASSSSAGGRETGGSSGGVSVGGGGSSSGGAAGVGAGPPGTSGTIESSAGTAGARPAVGQGGATSAAGPTSGAGADSVKDANSESGCRCALARNTDDGAQSSWLPLLAFGLLLRRRNRPW